MTEEFRDDIDCEDEGESAHRTIMYAGFVCEDANGAAWALGAYISTLESYVAGGRTKEEDDEDSDENDDEAEEEVPHVVHACC